MLSNKRKTTKHHNFSFRQRLTLLLLFLAARLVCTVPITAFSSIRGPDVSDLPVARAAGSSRRGGAGGGLRQPRPRLPVVPHGSEQQ